MEETSLEVKSSKITSEIQPQAKEIIDPRIISKRHDSKERDSISTAAWQARGERRKLGEKISGLEDEINSPIFRLRQILGIGKRSTDEKAKKLEVLREQLKDMPEGEDLIEAYYERIQTTPLTKEEKKQFLRPEILASLSMEEYIILWRRLNPYFVTHVTRQGFRDNYVTLMHDAGAGEFHNNFINSMADKGMLRPPLALKGLDKRDKETIRNFLTKGGVFSEESRKEAMNRVYSMISWRMARAPAYPDKTAVHFVVNNVGDILYGAETNNEVFYVFPADYAASQYSFDFNHHRLGFDTDWMDENNDCFIWPSSLEDPGILINSGIVFLPGEMPVDPNTGSKYASETRRIGGQVKRVRIKDTGLTKAFVHWGLTNESRFKELIRSGNPYDFSVELQKVGFCKDASDSIINLLFDLPPLNILVAISGRLTEKSLQMIASESKAMWKRPEITIFAREYWESLFVKNPNLRPKHVHYYSGNPHAAVGKFLRESRIYFRGEGEDGRYLGFDDNHSSMYEKDSNAMLGYEELVQTAEELVDDYFKNKDL